MKNKAVQSHGSFANHSDPSRKLSGKFSFPFQQDQIKKSGEHLNTVQKGRSRRYEERHHINHSDKGSFKTKKEAIALLVLLFFQEVAHWHTLATPAQAQRKALRAPKDKLKEEKEKHCKTLHIPVDADWKAIKKAFRACMWKEHPDRITGKHPELIKERETQTRLCIEALEYLDSIREKPSVKSEPKINKEAYILGCDHCGNETKVQEIREDCFEHNQTLSDYPIDHSNVPTPSKVERVFQKNISENPSMQNPEFFPSLEAPVVNIEPISLQTQVASHVNTLVNSVADTFLSVAFYPFGVLSSFAQAEAKTEKTDLHKDSIPFTKPIEKPEYTAPVSPSYEGKLKPIAEKLTKYHEAFSQYGKENPIKENVLQNLDMTLLKIGKETLVETILQAAKGQSSLRDFSDVNALVKEGNSLIQQIKSANYHGYEGDQVDWLIHSGVSNMAYLFKKFDTTLDDTQSKILAMSLITSGLNTEEFAYANEGLYRALNEDLSSPSYINNVMDQKGSMFGGFKTTNPRDNHFPFETFQKNKNSGSGFGNNNGDDSAFKPGSSQAENSGIPFERQKANDPFSNLFQEKDENPSSSFLNPIQGFVSEGVKMSQGLMAMDQGKLSEKEIQELKMQAESFSSYAFKMQTFAGAFHDFSTLLSISGNTKFARQFMQIGNTALKIVDTVHALTTFSKVSNVFGAGSMGVMGFAYPPLAMLGVFTSLVSLFSSFGEDDNDGMVQIYNALSDQMTKGFTAISNQIQESHNKLATQIEESFKGLSSMIEQLNQHMNKRFDLINKRFDLLADSEYRYYQSLFEGIVRVGQNFQNFEVSTHYQFDSIKRELELLPILDSKINDLLLKDFIEAWLDIDKYPDLIGPLSSMNGEKVIKYDQILANVLLGQSVKYENFNGYMRCDFSPQVINTMLSSYQPASLLGYFGRYMQEKLKEPVNVDPATLPNLHIWEAGSDMYSRLRENTKQVPYDVKGKQLEQIAEVGEHAMTFIHGVRTNKSLMQKLVTNYETSLKNVEDVIIKAINDKSQTLATATLEEAKNFYYKYIENKLSCTDDDHGLVPRNDPINNHPNDVEKAKLSVNKRVVQPYDEHCKKVIDEMNERKKEDFTLDFSQSKEMLLKNIEKSQNSAQIGSVNTFLLPIEPIKHNWRNLFYPISFSKAWNRPTGMTNCILPPTFLAEAIPPKAILAERLGLGMIYFGYRPHQDSRGYSITVPYPSGGTPIRSEIRIFFKFNAKNEKSKETIQPILNSFVNYNIEPIDNLLLIRAISVPIDIQHGLYLRSGVNNNDRERSWVGDLSSILDLSDDTMTQNQAYLSEEVDKKLLNIRLESFSTRSSKYHTEFLQANEELLSSIKLLEYVSTITGNSQLKKQVAKLWDGEKITVLFKELSENGTNSTQLFPDFKEVYKNILSSNSSEQEINPFEMPILMQIVKLKLLAEEFKNRAQDNQKKSEKTPPSNSEKETSSK